MASNLSIALMIGASVGGAIAGIKRLQTTLNTLRNNTLTTTAKLKSLAGTTTLGLAGTISSVKATSGIVMNIAEPAIKFESAMADVKKVVDFKTPEGFKNLSKDILELTRTLPMTAEELAAITASGGQLGVAEEDLKDFTTTIAKMSVAFDMSAQESGDAMAKLANVYKIPIGEIGKLGDAINELSNSSPAKASDIVNTLGRIGGVSKQFGLTENAAAALANSFISLGKAPEVAGTAINGMLTKLMTADKGGKKFQAALKSMGLSAKEVKTAISKDAQGALTDFLKKIEKLPKDKQMGILVDLFGLEYADDVAVLAGNTKVLEESIKTLQETDENGKPKYISSMEKEFSARAATTENGLQLLKNSVTEFWTALGAKLLPVINNVAGKLAGIMHWITDLITQNSWLADTFLYLGGAVAGLFTGFSALTAVIGTVSMTWVVMSKPILKTIGIIRTVLGWGRQLIILFSTLGVKVLDMAITFGKGLLMMSRALLTNPIGLTITAIAVAAYLVYSNWEKIGPWFSNLWSNVSGYFSNFCTWVQGIWNGAIDWVSTAWNGVTNFFSGLWTEITTAFDGGILGIGKLILNWSPIGLFHQAFAAVMSWFGIDVPKSFTDFGAAMIDSLINGIKSAWESVKGFVTSIGDSIKNAFSFDGKS
ncbi:phage tail tape measure protein, partial [Ursidibacter sp. B-7004-1]